LTHGGGHDWSAATGWRAASGTRRPCPCASATPQRPRARRQPPLWHPPQRRRPRASRCSPRVRAAGTERNARAAACWCTRAARCEPARSDAKTNPWRRNLTSCDANIRALPRAAPLPSGAPGHVPSGWACFAAGDGAGLAAHGDHRRAAVCRGHEPRGHHAHPSPRPHHRTRPPLPLPHPRSVVPPPPLYSDAKVANRNGRDFGREIAHGAVTRRLPIPLYTVVPRTGGYTYDVGVWDLSIVQGTILCRAVPAKP
jgi:hypothetical protein